MRNRMFPKLVTLLGLSLAWGVAWSGASRAQADEPWQSPAVSAAKLPLFKHVGVALDEATLKYSPKDNAMMPSIVRTDHFKKPLGKYYMYFSPHNGACGICMAYSDNIEGPWHEYDANPLITNIWKPHYATDHASGPHALWVEEEKKVFLYYHGPNGITRFATTEDGIHFEYGGVAVDRFMFDEVFESSYARVQRYTIPGKDNRYILMFMGRHNDTRKIYLAWSKDARKWEVRKEPLIAPLEKDGQLAGAMLLPWNGKLYIVYHNARNFTDLFANEMDPTLEHTKYLGLFYPTYASFPSNRVQGLPCFFEEGDKLYLFTNTRGEDPNQRGLVFAVAPNKPVIDEELEARQKAAQSHLSNWPEGKSPETVGHKLVSDFLGREIRHDRPLHDSESLGWMGALRFSRQITGFLPEQKLLENFRFWITPVADKLAASRTIPETRFFGALEGELFLPTREWRYQLYVKRFADAQWGSADSASLPADARILADDLLSMGLLQAQAFRASAMPTYLERCAATAKGCIEKLQQPNGLFVHAADSPVFWGRGNGMAAAGLAEILRVLPKEHPQRPFILAGYEKLMKGALANQGPTGLWKQVIGQPESWEESSGSGLIAYAMITGLKEGWLEAATYGPAARKAWLGLVERMDNKGWVRDTCEETPALETKAANDPGKASDYYNNRKRLEGDLQGQAALLWCAYGLLR